MKNPPKKRSPAGKPKPKPELPRQSPPELPRQSAPELPPELPQELNDPGSNSRQEKYVLRLYVSGSTAKSALAVVNTKRICERHLKNRYALEVIDIYQQPNLARDEQIVAVPMLIKQSPLPLRRLIGDLSNLKKVLLGLDLGVQE